jgi:hypothetical protein
MTANETLDFLQEKFSVVHDRCTIRLNNAFVGNVPTIEYAINLLDPFVGKNTQGVMYAQTPVWSALFPMFWWQRDRITNVLRTSNPTDAEHEQWVRFRSPAWMHKD